MQLPSHLFIFYMPLNPRKFHCIYPATDYGHPMRKSPSLTLTILLASLSYWYTHLASPHHVGSGVHSWREPRGGTNKCTASEGSLRTYCSIPYTGPSLHGQKSNPNSKFLGKAEAYFVCHIGPKFQIYAFIGRPQSVYPATRQFFSNDPFKV